MASEGKCFTFEWRLKNISFCTQRKGEALKSSAFVVDAIEHTKWRLCLYPRGDSQGTNIGYFLHREKDSSGRDKVEIKYELAVVGVDGRVMENNGIQKQLFSRGQGFGFGNITFDYLFVTWKSVFLPNNTLTLRCRIWKSEGEMSENVKCTTVTCIGVDERSYKWDVKNFSSQVLSVSTLTHDVKSAQTDSPLITVCLQLPGYSVFDAKRTIYFDLYPRDQTIKCASLRLFLLNSSGNRIACNQKRIWFDLPNTIKRLTFTFTENDLLERKGFYLANDMLSLIWEWVFYKGVVSEDIEEDRHGCICSEVKISGTQNISGNGNLLFGQKSFQSDSQKTLLTYFEPKVNNSHEERSLPDNQKTLLNAFVDNVKCLYDERFLSDVKLKTATREFPAHKFMLSASSSVFKAMFSSSMMEKLTNFVFINDLDDDTVSRMLHFIYTTRVRDLTWESASKLYFAAHKYAILSLKNICSSFLKEHLSPSNVCYVLLLADSHADDDLKAVVQYYILKNGRQITASDQWKSLMVTNASLVAETLGKLYE